VSVEGQRVKIPNTHLLAFLMTKLTVTHSLTSLLRFTAHPTTYRCTFSTSTHNTLNVMRGHNFSLCHSVEHYKARLIDCRFIIFKSFSDSGMCA
jgi:hypothetical protein